MFQPKVEDSARATFELKRGGLDKIKGRILQKWESQKEKEEREESTISKPQNLSTFVLTTAYVLVCIAKAMERTGGNKTRKLLFAFTADCRARLDPAIPENYFGNCVMPQIIETQQEDLKEDDGIVIVAKKIHRKMSKVQKENGALDGAETLFSKHSNEAMAIGVAGSTRFGVYPADFGWGRPEKVEITSVDRGISMAMAESKDGDGGVEVGIALKNQVMDQFASLFQTEMESF